MDIVNHTISKRQMKYKIKHFKIYHRLNFQAIVLTELGSKANETINETMRPTFLKTIKQYVGRKRLSYF